LTTEQADFVSWQNHPISARHTILLVDKIGWLYTFNSADVNHT